MLQERWCIAGNGEGVVGEQLVALAISPIFHVICTSIPHQYTFMAAADQELGKCDYLNKTYWT